MTNSYLMLLILQNKLLSEKEQKKFIRNRKCVFYSLCLSNSKCVIQVFFLKTTDYFASFHMLNNLGTDVSAILKTSKSLKDFFRLRDEPEINSHVTEYVSELHYASKFSSLFFYNVYFVKQIPSHCITYVKP